MEMVNLAFFMVSKPTTVEIQTSTALIIIIIILPSKNEILSKEKRDATIHSVVTFHAFYSWQS